MKKQNKSLEKALELIKNKKIIVDTKVLHKIEAAEMGDLTACFSLACDFSTDSDGVKKDYNMAKYYLNKVKKEKYNNTDSSEKFRLLFQEGLIEDSFKNYNLALKKYEVALKFMVSKIPPKDWDYNFLKTISGIKYFCENQALFENSTN